MSDLNLAERTILFDGGMGGELCFRGVDIMTPIWSAKAIIEASRTRRRSSMSVCRGYRGESIRGFMNGEAYTGRATHAI